MPGPVQKKPSKDQSQAQDQDQEELDYRSPNWSAAKATAKEMWNAKDFVPAKQKLFKKLRDVGVPDAAVGTLDAVTPDNPTQLAADVAGGVAVKGLVRGAQGVRRLLKLKELRKGRAAAAAEKEAWKAQDALESDAKDMVKHGLAEDEEEAMQLLKNNPFK